MNNVIIASTVIAIFLLSLFVAVVPRPATAETTSANNTNMSQPQYASAPSVAFPSMEQVKMLSEQRGFKNMALSTIMDNQSVSDIRATADANNTLFVVWVSGTNHVWLSKSNTTSPQYGGGNYSSSYYQRIYTKPVEISPSGPRNATNMQNVTNLDIAVNGRTITVVWQFFNETSGKYNIFGAQSENGGSTWDAHLLSPSDVNSINPILATAGFVYWAGENESTCGNPWGPHDKDHKEDVTGSNNNNNDEHVAFINLMKKPIIVCMHGW